MRAVEKEERKVTRKIKNYWYRHSTVLANLNWTSLGDGNLVHRRLNQVLKNNDASMTIDESYVTVIITCPKAHRCFIPGGNVPGLKEFSTQVGHVGLALWGGRENVETIGICSDGSIEPETFSSRDFKKGTGTDIHFWTCTITPEQKAEMLERKNTHEQTPQNSRYNEFNGWRVQNMYNCVTFTDSILSAGLGISSKLGGLVAGCLTPWYYNQSFIGAFGWNHSALRGMRHN